MMHERDERGEATTLGVLVALLVVLGGWTVASFATFVTVVVGQVGETATGTGPAAIISGLSSLGSVGGLVYIAKKMVSGELVARNPANAEAKLLALVEAAQRREDRAAEREARALDRESDYRAMLVTGGQGDQ